MKARITIPVDIKQVEQLMEARKIATKANFIGTLIEEETQRQAYQELAKMRGTLQMPRDTVLARNKLTGDRYMITEAEVDEDDEIIM